MEAATGTETQEIECPYCAEKISNRAKKCRHCGEILDVVMRELEMVRSKRGDIIVNNASSASAASSSVSSPVQEYTVLRKIRSKGAAILWCLFLGGFGAHKFYLGQPGLGLLYLIFFWTLIPAIIAVVELVYLVLLKEDDFNRKFNWGVR